MTENGNKVHKAVVTGDLAGARLDKALATLLPDLSRTRLKALMQDGLVEKAGQPVDDPSAKVEAGDIYHVSEPPAEDATPKGEDLSLKILYEDKDVIVIDKPAGLVVHPAPGNSTGTLVNALIHHCGDSLSGIGGVRRPGIVHRLDKDTSGVMVAAKNDMAHKSLTKQFSAHTIERRYLALVPGVPSPLSGRVDTLISRHTRNRKKMAVSDVKGKEARTRYQTKEIITYKGQQIAALVECTLETGRTHQVRVHMAHLGHPLIGDKLYSRGKVPKVLSGTIQGTAWKAFPRQALHAAHLAFTHPATGEPLAFDAPAPKDMKDLVKTLKN